MGRSTVKVFAVVFVPVEASTRYERGFVLFASREAAEHAQDAMVNGSGGFTVAGQTYFCKPNQGVFVEERTVF